jgi:LPXTG-site transpeptidase (sortase) family protein
MQSRCKNRLRWIESLLWIAAGATLGYSALVAAEGRLYQFYLNQTFNDARGARTIDSLVLTLPGSPFAGGAGSRALSPYIGRLEIPRLEMSIMILDGVDNGTLRRGIGHIPGTALPGESGNAGIAGHRDSFFRGLEQIRKHDRMTVQTFDRAYHYEVDSIRVVDPGAVEVLNNTGHPILTLVTCYPFHLVGPAPKRFVVQASLKE